MAPHTSPNSKTCSEESENLQNPRMGTTWFDVAVVIENCLSGTVEPPNEAHSKYEL